jgi:hypothetical protein
VARPLSTITPIGRAVGIPGAREPPVALERTVCSAFDRSGLQLLITARVRLGGGVDLQSGK